MANTIIHEIDASVTGDTAYHLQPGVEYNFQLSGTGFWEYDETGSAAQGHDSGWVAFTAGSGKTFIGSSATGHVRAHVTSGTCILRVVKHGK